MLKFTRYSNVMIKYVVPLSTIYTPMKVTRKGVNILVYIVPIKLAIKSLHSYQDVVNVALWASVWSKHKEEGGPPGPPPGSVTVYHPASRAFLSLLEKEGKICTFLKSLQT